jgi:hypothetical protein
MIRIALVFSFGTLLAACSGSSRVENILPGWANTPPPPATQYMTHKRQLEDGSKPVAESRSGPVQNPESQEAKETELRHVSDAQNPSEE